MPSSFWYRITGVPLGVNERDLRAALEALDPSLRSANYELKLYPSAEGRQTVLLHLMSPSQYFQALKDDEPNSAHIRLGGGGAGINIAIDSTFHELTELNAPTGNVVADVIGVTGLGGHAFGSWTNRGTKNMWLHDFLPKTFNNVRIMTYGYDSKIVGEPKVENRIEQLRKNFIAALTKARKSTAEKKRPIIFIGHSLGALLIVEALTASMELAAATQCIMFFGAPHRGLDVSDLVVMAQSVQGPWRQARIDLVERLKVDAHCIAVRLDSFAKVMKTMAQDASIISFYEEKMTNKYEMTPGGKPKVSREMTMRATKDSSLLYVPLEYQISVGENHTDLVKFAAPNDSTYQIVVRFLDESLRKIKSSRR